MAVRCRQQPGVSGTQRPLPRASSWRARAERWLGSGPATASSSSARRAAGPYRGTTRPRRGDDGLSSAWPGRPGRRDRGCARAAWVTPGPSPCPGRAAPRPSFVRCQLGPAVKMRLSIASRKKMSAMLAGKSSCRSLTAARRGSSVPVSRQGTRPGSARGRFGDQQRHPRIHRRVAVSPITDAARRLSGIPSCPYWPRARDHLSGGVAAQL
jgi:hypothetical protein